MKTINIYGEDFELVASQKMYDSIIERVRTSRYYNLYSAYRKPSARKTSIYTQWVSWSIQCTALYDIKIISRNTNVFTLGMWIFYNGVHIALYITPSHNIACVVDKSLFKRLEQ